MLEYLVDALLYVAVFAFGAYCGRRAVTPGEDDDSDTPVTYRQPHTTKQILVRTFSGAEYSEGSYGKNKLDELTAKAVSVDIALVTNTHDKYPKLVVAMVFEREQE